MSTKKDQNFSENENTCVVCFKNVDIYSIGDCDHPVCFECSTRMRVLCLQNECPICRRDMPKVIFTTDVETFVRLKPKALSINLLDKKFGIYFMTSDIERAYLQLLIHRCSKCDNEIFQTFQQLKDHMRRQHEVFYCDLCSENLKIFSFERRFYNRSQLALHRRKGDPDDKSHKGHPLCEFCDTRYMDSDELYRHLRRDHLYCHFCDADGKHHYYSSYEFLRQHFQNEHFLCEEGDCKTEQFTSVFRTDIDLKAHKASAHGRQLGKIGAKQARTLELEFRLAPRPRPGDPQNQQQARQARIPPPQTLGQHLGMNVEHDWPDEDGAMGGFDTAPTESRTPQNPIHKKPINALDPNLFPSLGGAPAPTISAIASKPLTRSSGGGSGITIRHTRQNLAKNDENFPALSTEVPSGSTLRFSVNASSSSNGPTITKTPNVSIHVNHRPGSISVTGPTSTRISKITESSSSKETHTKTESLAEAFPVLGSGTDPVQPAQWIKLKSKDKPKPNKTAPVPTSPINKISNNLKNFPSLSKTVTNGDGFTASPQKQNKPETPVKKLGPNSCSSEESSVKSSSTETKTKNKKKKTKTSGTTSPTNITMPPTKESIKKNGTAKTISALENDNSKSESKKKNKTQEVKKENNVETKKTTSPNQNGKVERKRSELNIGNLKTPNLQSDDFPTLGSTSSSSSVKKPPGFDSWPVKGPPPGFRQPPPPGFNTIQLNMVAQSANDLTFTNSSGQKYSILPNNVTKNNTIFYSPPNFNHRNKKLVQSFMTALSDGDLNEFRQLSHLFKQGSYTARNYYDYCKKCLGVQFENIFPELLALLPDIKKQKELYDIYSKDKKSMNNNSVHLDLCAICGQVCVSNDLKHHVANHTLENHFPVLGGGTVGEISTAWKK
ncbi:E3 ubiquitin-protein ligase ZNF598 isoform X2 [Chrysoperla carnea]|uniref:E3 ubiquitin-protein ligase ZNF598 isoform X2 n=1 Tax=Chrysoperla carnea TaxID=189513 RepID=UPI001D068642|nr:E3 ubiquitin-protein ligase ZNF598 isoform X2 [Chrysoperla carnea]